MEEWAGIGFEFDGVVSVGVVGDFDGCNREVAEPGAGGVVVDDAVVAGEHQVDGAVVAGCLEAGDDSIHAARGEEEAGRDLAKHERVVVDVTDALGVGGEELGGVQRDVEDTVGVV